jgi:hypothetical protein
MSIGRLSVALGLAIAFCQPSSVRAEALTIADASLIEFAAGTGAATNRVYLRNLNTFSSAWSGCCEHYYFDLSTPNGMAQFANLLTAIGLKGPISLFKQSASTDGEIVQVGKF